MNKKQVSYWSNHFKFYAGKKLLRAAFMRLAVPVIKGRVLDVGSGRTPFSGLLKGCDVVTMDYDSKREPMTIGSSLDLPFSDESFDSIICTEVLEHVPEPARALAEIKRVLKPGGEIYLTAPMMWCLHYEPHDFFRYTRYGLDHLFTEAGLVVKEIEPIGGLFSFLSMRFGERFYNILNKVLFFLPRGIRIYPLIALVWPVNIITYILSRVLDPLAGRDVFSWASVASKRGR